MSALVKLSAKLPGNPEINGLDPLADDLATNPDQITVAIVWLDVSQVTRKTDELTTVPTVRIRRIEPIGPVASVPHEIQQLAAELEQRRTGRRPLPFGEIEAIHGEQIEEDSYQHDPDYLDEL